MEVGCGQGDFLSSLCEAGENLGFGFDPSYLGGNDDPRVTIHCASFADVEDVHETDLVCCRHVLEHIDNPRQFLAALAGKLVSGTAVYFEVPNVLYTLRDGGIWDIIYEHCGYFSPSSLRRVFQLSGYHVAEVAEVFHGQFLAIHAQVSSDPVTYDSVDPSLEEHSLTFAELYRDKVRRWHELLQFAEGNAERVVAWELDQRVTLS